MPVYLYECLKCGKEIEIEQRITEDALKTILHSDENDVPCAGEVKRLIAGGVTAQFSGSGWTPRHYD